jgi:hypothetical protein
MESIRKLFQLTFSRQTSVVHEIAVDKANSHLLDDIQFKAAVLRTPEHINLPRIAGIGLFSDDDPNIIKSFKILTDFEPNYYPASLLIKDKDFMQVTGQSERIRLGQKVAKGMSFLHKKFSTSPIIHFRLKSSNVLVLGCPLNRRLGF